MGPRSNQVPDYRPDDEPSIKQGIYNLKLGDVRRSGCSPTRRSGWHDLMMELGSGFRVIQWQEPLAEHHAATTAPFTILSHSAHWQPHWQPKDMPQLTLVVAGVTPEHLKLN